MSLFTLTCISKESSGDVIYYYNTDNNIILNKDKDKVCFSGEGEPTCEGSPLVSISNLSKNSEGISTLKIQLGMDCNYSCGYCNQCNVRQYSRGVVLDVDKLVAKIPFIGDRIEFWGGEPLLYWKFLKPLAEALRLKFPSQVFYMPTNGSLLTLEINDWLEKLGFSISISHDGPGQWQRGKDILADPIQKEIIRDLFNRLSPIGRFSFNPMLTKNNYNRAEINEWFASFLGCNYFSIGEGGLIRIPDDSKKEFGLNSKESMFHYRRSLLRDIRYATAPNFKSMYDISGKFYRDLENHTSLSCIGSSCGIDRSDVLIIDCAGNILTCQNVSASSSNEGGISHILGSIDKVNSVLLNTIINWRQKEACTKCSVIHMCRGGCMISSLKLNEFVCNNLYSEYIPHLASTIEYITGALPYYVEGPIDEDKKDIFGVADNPRILFDDKPGVICE